MKAEVFLPLSQGKVAVVDFDDFEKVRGLKWHAFKNGGVFYAIRVVRENGKQRKVLLHRVITGCPPNLEVNHINGDGLDNRRENLQVCTVQQNAFAHRRKSKAASSKFRGVTWVNSRNHWVANLTHCGKAFHLGYFDSEEDAARAYDTKARELFGVHASPNFS